MWSENNWDNMMKFVKFNEGPVAGASELDDVRAGLVQINDLQFISYEVMRTIAWGNIPFQTCQK